MNCPKREGLKQCIWYVLGCQNKEVSSPVKKVCNGKLERIADHKGTWCDKGNIFCQEGFCSACEIARR
jgi:hypothetical protein